MPGTKRCVTWCAPVSNAVHALRRARQQLSGFLLRQWLPLPAAGLDQAASPLARGSQVRAGGAHIVLEDYVQAVEACGGAARSADGADRGDAAGLVAGAGRGGAANDARHGLGQCGDADCRTGRPLALCQSAPADVPISGWCPPSIRAVRASDAAASPRPATQPARRLLIEAAWSYRFPAPAQPASCLLPGRRASPS